MLRFLFIAILFLAIASPASAQSREQERLEANIVRAFAAARYERALEQIDEYLEKWPSSPLMVYNKACGFALTNRRDAAGQALLEAVELGFRDFGHMKQDPDLESMRDHPTFIAIVAAQGQADQSASNRQLEKWKNRFGEDDYTFESDSKRRIHFVTSVDPTAHKQMKEMLQGQADQMSETLFGSPPDYWCLIAVPTADDAKTFFEKENTAGIYIHASRRLVSRDIGASMRHEFGHLMHFGHMERLGRQKHPIWIQEGLASLYEDYTVDDDGTFTFHPNGRHNKNHRQVDRHVALSFEKLLALDARSFMAGNARYYPQVRSVFEFLAALGVLEEWYETYTSSFQRDSSGKYAFEKTFGLSLDAVERRWRNWVLDRGEIDDRIDYGDASIGVAGVEATDGVRIVEFKGLSARRVGLKIGDVIVAVDDTPVRTRSELILAIAQRDVGDRVRLRIRRGDTHRTISITLQPLSATVHSP